MLLSEKNKIKWELFAITNFQQEFQAILSFVTELCEIQHAFISFIDTDNQIIHVNVGFDFLTIPESVLFYQQYVIQQNKISIVTAITQDVSYNLNPFSFFAGLPICINDNLVVGTLCIMDTKPKLLSLIELKSLNHAVSQIQFLLELYFQNKELQKIVLEKENQFELFIENSNEIFYELTLDGIINYTSENWTASVGHEINEVIGKKASNFIHPEDIERVMCFLNKLTLGVKSDEEIIYRILHKDGYYIWHSSCVKLVKKGSEQFYIGNCRDITANVKVLLNLSPQKEFYEKILDCLPIDISVWDYYHKYTYLNPVAIKNDELRNPIIKKNDFEYAEDTARANTFSKNRGVKFIEALQTRDTVEWEDMIELQNGQKTYQSIKFVPVFLENESLEMMIGFGVDITARKNSEDALNISNEYFTYSSKATSDVLWDWNMITDKIFVRESFYVHFGHRFESNIITKQEYENYIHPEDRDSYFESIEKVTNSNFHRWSHEYRYLKAVGTYAHVKNKGVIMRNDTDKAIRIIGVMQDITKEKKRNDVLQEIEQRFKSAFEHSFIGMALISPQGHWNEVNNKVCQMLGYSKDELKVLTFQDLTHHEDLKLDLTELQKLIDGEISNYNIKKRYIHKNKSIIYAHLSVSLIRNNNGEIINFISQIIDITERKKMEDENKLLIELNEAKNMYRLLANNTIDLVCLHNLDSSFQYVSPSIKNLLGYTPEELIGKFPHEFVHPKDIETLQNSIVGFITEIEDVSVRVRFRNIENNYFWFEIKAILVKENGIPINFQSSTRDITLRKEAEEIVENTLIQERELNELRTNLISTISHEFRTPMTTIRTSVELIAMYLEGFNFENSIHVAKRVNTITEEIDRIVELMDAVLTISKDDSGKTNFNPVEFDLKQVCIDVIENSYSDQLDKRKVQTLFEGEIFSVFADRNLMKYALFNLLNNAFKYSKGSGDVILKLFVIDGKVVVEIIDFGIGIPEEDQTKLFNTFFRASNATGIQGTGLGLYIIKTFTEKNLGTVQLKSVLGKGTKVTLQFQLLT